MKFAGTVVALVTALVGASLLSTSVYGQEISACVTSAGVLRIVGDASECRLNESPLAWNVQGPTGPEGPEGPEGPASEFGDLWLDNHDGIPFISELSIAGAGTVIAERTVPAGNYLVIAKATVVDVDNFQAERCWLDVNGFVVDEWWGTGAVIGLRSNISLMTHVGSTFSDAVVRFYCSGGTSPILGDDAVNFVRLRILEIGTIHLIDGTEIPPPGS